jgi:hypothetical protein
MTESNDKPASWEKVDGLIRTRESPLTSTAATNKEALEAIPAEASKIRDERLDLIGRIKSNSIERKAGLEAIQAMYAAQMEVGKHRLKRAVDVERQRVDLVARKYIYQITEEYLRDMRGLGMHNYNARMETLLKLNEETTKLLEKAEAQQVPESIKDKTIDAIVKKHAEFYERIIADEISLDERQRSD